MKIKLQLRHWLIIAATAAFFAGGLIYPYRTYIGHTEGVFLQSYSAFSHALFFSLALAYPYKSIKSTISFCTLIMLIVSFFEALQLPAFLEYCQNYLPQIIINYARNGVFDMQDISAGIWGCLLAMLLGSITQKVSKPVL